MFDESRKYICLIYGVQRSFGWTLLGVPSHQNRNERRSRVACFQDQAGILIQDELQLERHQAAAHDYLVYCEQALLPGFVVISLSCI
jgi:hypothetical protein